MVTIWCSEQPTDPAREPTQLSPILAPQSEPYSWEYLRSILFTLLDAVLYDSSRLNLILISRDLAISEGFSATLLSLSDYFSHRIHGTQPQDCYITAVCHEVAVMVNESYQLLCPTCVTPSVCPSVCPSRNSCSRQKPTSCHETQPQISLCHETQEGGPSTCHETQGGESSHETHGRTGHETTT